MNKENIETILELILIVCIMASVMRAVMYSDGCKCDDLFKMINGTGIMIVMGMILYTWYASILDRQKNKEIEELKTDLALLQNRCDWLEDDICKECHEETKKTEFSHNIEDDIS